MKHFSHLLASGPSLLGYAVILCGVAAAAPAAAQSGQQTCRVALGDNFSIVQGSPGDRCCMVAEEQSWYDANDVIITRVYLTFDSRKVKPRLCSAASTAGLAEEDDGPDLPPVSLASDPEDTPTRVYRDVYY